MDLNSTPPRQIPEVGELNPLADNCQLSTVSNPTEKAYPRLLQEVGDIKTIGFYLQRC